MLDFDFSIKINISVSL